MPLFAATGAAGYYGTSTSTRTGTSTTATATASTSATSAPPPLPLTETNEHCPATPLRIPARLPRSLRGANTVLKRPKPTIVVYGLGDRLQKPGTLVIRLG